MAEKQVVVESFTDKAGNPVRVGDYILYGHAMGRSAGLAFGKVLKIEAVIDQDRVDYYIKNIGVCDTWGRLSLNGSVGTLYYPDRIVNANSFIPEAYKALYKGTKYDV